MALKYKPTIWKDDVPDVQTGTDLDAAHFNNNERATFEALALADLNAVFHRYAMDETAQAAIMTIAFAAAKAMVMMAPGLQSVALPAGALRNTTDYDVEATVVSAEGGEVEKVTIGTKQANGFKASYEGSAESATIVFKVTGGML